MVRIYVGPQKTLWCLPESLLCDRVKFFKSAFQSGFRESKEKILELSHDNPVAFSYVVDGILGRCRNMNRRVKEGDDAIQLALCKAYLLADKLGLRDIANKAARHYEELLWEGLEIQPTGLAFPPAVKLVYENSLEVDTMRRTICSISAGWYSGLICCSEEELKKWSELLMCHPQFHLDMMRAIKKSWKDFEKKGEDAYCEEDLVIFTRHLMREKHGISPPSPPVHTVGTIHGLWDQGLI